MAGPDLQALAVLRRRAPGGAQVGAKDDGRPPFPARHVVHFGGLVDQLIHDDGQKVAKHDIDHRAQTGHGGADRQPGKTGFGDGRIHDALRAKLLHQPGGDFEGRAGFRHIFADQEDRGVAAQFFGQRFAHCLRPGNLAYPV